MKKIIQVEYSESGLEGKYKTAHPIDFDSMATLTAKINEYCLWAEYPDVAGTIAAILKYKRYCICSQKNRSLRFIREW